MEKNEVFMKVSNLIKKPKKNYVRAKSKLFSGFTFTTSLLKPFNKRFHKIFFEFLISRVQREY